MEPADEVIAAATRRANALSRHDRDELAALLHPLFIWTSHKGETFNRRSYLDANTSGPTAWHGQQLTDIDVRVIDDVAILLCTVVDDVTTDARRASFTMPMTRDLGA